MTETEWAERYRLMVELTPDAVIVHQGGVVQFCNPATSERFIGVAGTIVGRPITDFVDPKSIPAMWQRLTALKNQGDRTQPAEAQLKRLDGSKVWVETVGVLTEWEGKPAVQTILRDISSRKVALLTRRNSFQAACLSFLIGSGLWSVVTGMALLGDGDRSPALGGLVAGSAAIALVGAFWRRLLFGLLLEQAGLAGLLTGLVGHGLLYVVERDYPTAVLTLVVVLASVDRLRQIRFELNINWGRVVPLGSRSGVSV